MKSQGLRAVALVGMALLLLAGAFAAKAAAEGDAGVPPGQGVSYTVQPEHPTELDQITVNVLIRDGGCYILEGVELTVSEDEIDIRVVATESEVCPAVDGPFEMKLPVPIGRLDAGTYAIDVAFRLCGAAFCAEIGIGGGFDVVAIGDADCDSTVNSIDANVVLQSSARLIDSAPCESAADANRDGAVRSTDATLILQYTAGLLGQLPPE